MWAPGLENKWLENGPGRGNRLYSIYSIFGSAVVYTQGTRAHKTAWNRAWTGRGGQLSWRWDFLPVLCMFCFLVAITCAIILLSWRDRAWFVESTTSIYFPMAPLGTIFFSSFCSTVILCGNSPNPPLPSKNMSVSSAAILNYYINAIDHKFLWFIAC